MSTVTEDNPEEDGFSKTNIPANVYVFPNGNVAVFGFDDLQITSLQGVNSPELMAKIKAASTINTKFHL